MAIDVGDIAQKMLSAALPILKKGASDAESFAKTEFTKLAQTVTSIAEQLASKVINQQQASLLFDMQKSASRNVFLTLEGISLLTAEQAINAALGAVATIVDKAVGFALI